MGPSKQVNWRTNKKDLAKRLDGVAQQGLESHNQQVLWEYHLDFEALGIVAMTKDLWSGDQEWNWMELPQVSGMVPWLIFLYGGKFTFQDQVEIKESLEVYDCAADCSRICLFKKSRVLVIYK